MSQSPSQMGLLYTKLHPPPVREKQVDRRHLFEKLDAALSQRLTLVCAPAGYGKTTLLSQWISHYAQPVGWVSLDRNDNDPAQFLHYFLAALQHAEPNFGLRIPEMFTDPLLPPGQAVWISLVNDISVSEKQFVIILDDYHEVEDRAVHNAVEYLIGHMPDNLHLIIATRADPPLALARLRARGHLIELRLGDLRFSREETADFLNSVMSLGLSARDIAALENRTEGWVAGLQLAALSMQNRQDTASFIESFTGSHRFVLDYLVEEVLRRQPERVRNFLLRTSILDRLCGSLCDAITDQENGKEMLEALEHGNLFVNPLDDQRRWYRYHRLFADVLQAYLREEYPDRLSTLHRRASVWFEQNDLPGEAIDHALAAKDFERAAILIELAVPEMRKNRQGATVTELGWLKALPDELVHFRPVLCVDYAYALFGGGELKAVEARLRDAERWLDKTSDKAGMIVVDEEEFRRLPGMIALLRAAQALARSDMPEAAINARRVLDLAPENAYLMLGGAASVLGLAAWASGDLEVAHRMTADGMANVRLAGYTSSAIGGAIVLADIQIAQGRLHEAMTTYERGLQWATELGAPVLRGAADMHVGMSSLSYEHNDLQTATQHLLTSQAMGELAGLPQNPYRWCAAMARIRETQGDLDGALDLLDKAERLYNSSFSPNVRPIATRKVRVWLTQGRFDEALGWARAQGLSVENELSYLHEFDHITLARVMLAHYQSNRTDRFIQEAMSLLERLLKAAEEGGRTGSVIEIRVLQAMVYHTQDNLPAALMSLQHALALAEPEGYVRMFLDEGPSMLQLLRETAAREIMPRQGLPNYTGKLLAAFEAEKQRSKGTSPLPPTQPQVGPEIRPAKDILVETLSQRELKILHLIAQGLSNREIGERLFIALDTVKGHNRKIFDKLQVQSRTEAIARARELGLL